jgi:hypothetical protein
MRFIRVRAAQTDRRPRPIFDQEVGARLPNSDARARVIIKTDGQAHTVDAALKVVKDAIERGELVALEPFEDEPKVVMPAPVEAKK